MKKVFFVLIAVLGLGLAANAQHLGVRLGGSNRGGGAEISWQQGIGANRLELDLGFTGLFSNNTTQNFINLTGVYQWHWNIIEGLGWFVGPGASLGIYPNSDDSLFGIAVGGQVGLDYDFPFPLQLSLDTRPMWNFLGAYTGFGWGASLGIRFRF